MPAVSPSRRFVRVVCGAALVGVLAGCQATMPAVKRSEQTTDLLVSTSQSLAADEQTVADAQAALRTLGQAKGDLREPFAAFAVQLDAVRKEADRVRQESHTVDTRSASYCSLRQSDIRTISNDDMRQAAEQRAANVRGQCDTIKDMYAQVNGGFDRYLRNLADLQTYLSGELNYGTLDAGRRWVDEAVASGEQLRSQIRGLATQVQLTSNLLSPVPIATTQWPANLQQTGMLASGR